jgi:hypothetical protein
VPLAPMPWLFGFAHWRRAGFEKDRPAAFLPIGSAGASDGRLDVVVSPEQASSSRILGVRATPKGVAPLPAAPGPDAEELRRLRALGYVR